jgi:DNA polymerase-3 subunit delta
MLGLVASDDLRPAYLLLGTDRPKVVRAVARLRARFDPQAVESVSADDSAGPDVVAALNALGLFGAQRLVIVHGVERWKKADAEAVRTYLAAPAPGAVVALVAEDPPRDATLAQALGKVGEVLRFDIPKPKDPSVWVRAEFERLEAPTTDDAARRLVEIVGDDVTVLAHEIDKIATWASGDQIGARDVERLAVPAAGDAPMWVVSDAWGRRDVAAVLAACDQELEQGTEPFLIAVRLAAQVGLVRTAQALAEEGLTTRDIAGRLKKHEFRIRKALEHADRYSRDELDLAIVRLAELDAALKGASRLSAELELERTVIEITRAAETAAAAVPA